jgi:drug/metabolite transporter (DMT)-like permease
MDLSADPRVSAVGKSPVRIRKTLAVDEKAQPAAVRSSDILIGALCGIGAAFGWAAGFVAAKHGVSIGFSAADLAMHRYLWTGLLLLPVIFREGVRDLGGFGWGRGLVMSILAGPPQAILAYIGYMLVPLGHGATIQPACAAIWGLAMASVLLRERMTAQRIIGGIAIIAGLLAFGYESLTTIGNHGIGGDLLFATAGIFWATFGILLRQWHVHGTRAVAVIGALSIVVYTPIYFLFFDFHDVLRFSLAENLLQAVVQGLLAGVLPIFLFARAVILLGAGRAATFPALVPVFSLIIGYLTLGVVPTLAQLIGLAIVVAGFRITLL